MKKICSVYLPYDSGYPEGLKTVHWQLQYDYQHGTFDQAVTGALIALRERLRGWDRDACDPDPECLSYGQGMEILMEERHGDILARYGLWNVPSIQGGDEFEVEWDEVIPMLVREE